MQEEKQEPSLELKLPKPPDDLFKVETPVQTSPPPPPPPPQGDSSTTQDNFARDSSGNIRYKKNGEPALKRGRKSGSFSESLQNPDNPLEMTQAQLSTTLTGMFFAAGQTVFDVDDWTPAEQEFITNRNALLAVLKKRNVNASPEVQACLCFGTSFITRIGKENTQNKIKSWKEKIKARFRRKAIKEKVDQTGKKITGLFKRDKPE